MNYKLYQIDMKKDAAKYAFTGKDAAEKLGMGFPPPRKLYTLAYTGVCEELDPEGLFAQLNLNHPADYRTRSLSISDVIVYDIDGKELPLFCNSFGFLPIRFTENETGEIKTAFGTTETGSYVLLQDGDDEIKVDIESFLSHLLTFPNQHKEPVRLNPGQIFAVLQCFICKSNLCRNSENHKTLDEWTTSGMPNFDWFAKPGDIVDEAIYQNFLNILPPAAMSYGYLQVGEPFDHVPDENGNWKPIFMTFAQEDKEWRYLGYCFLHGTENKWKPMGFYEHLKKLLE